MGTSDRRPYLTAMVLNQALLDQMADNLDFGLEMVADIETPGLTIRASDRNKYVGGTFYSARCEFPVIKRTIGDWLSPTIEFSTLELPLSNVDGLYNNFLPGGANFDGWIGKEVEVRLGIRDSSPTFFSIYKGVVTDVGGLARDRSKITVRTRDRLDSLNQNFPKVGITLAVFPNAADDVVNTILPVIYGDWTVAPLTEVPDPTPGNPPIMTASVPTFIVNGADPTVISGASNLRLLISDNINDFFDTANVWLNRADVWEAIPAANVTAVSGNKDFEVIQGFTFEAAPYVYSSGDKFYVRVRGKDLGSGGIYDDNLVEQAKDILTTHGGAGGPDFASGWFTYRDKVLPVESSIFTIKSRVWQQDPENAVTYVLSMLEQVRLEMFVDKDLKLQLKALHLEEFDATPSFTIKQWDLQDGSIAPKLDDKNIWNRVRGEYAYDPIKKANARQTATFRNQDAIDQAGKEVSKKAVFPNLYVEGDVANQVKEMLRLATGYPEFIEMGLTPRAVLLDVGDFVALNVRMGSVVYENVPCMIREIGFDPKGLKTSLKVWSFQMTPFSGWTPGYSGTVGGSTATITQE